MQYQKVLKILESIPYLSVGLDVGADFSWMSIMLPNGILTGKPFKIIHSDPKSRELAVTKIKKAAKVGLDASLKTSIVPDGAVIDLRNPVHDYYYFKDLQSTTVLKLNAELKVSFPACSLRTRTPKQRAPDPAIHKILPGIPGTSGQHTGRAS